MEEDSEVKKEEEVSDKEKALENKVTALVTKFKAKEKENISIVERVKVLEQVVKALQQKEGHQVASSSEVVGVNFPGLLGICQS